MLNPHRKAAAAAAVAAAVAMRRAVTTIKSSTTHHQAWVLKAKTDRDQSASVDLEAKNL
jgi:hypothetical protein